MGGAHRDNSGKAVWFPQKRASWVCPARFFACGRPTVGLIGSEPKGVAGWLQHRARTFRRAGR